MHIMLVLQEPFSVSLAPFQEFCFGGKGVINTIESYESCSDVYIQLKSGEMKMVGNPLAFERDAVRRGVHHGIGTSMQKLNDGSSETQNEAIARYSTPPPKKKLLPLLLQGRQNPGWFDSFTYETISLQLLR